MSVGFHIVQQEVAEKAIGPLPGPTKAPWPHPAPKGK
jgi:hypothetical protein